MQCCTNDDRLSGTCMHFSDGNELLIYATMDVFRILIWAQRQTDKQTHSTGVRARNQYTYLSIYVSIFLDGYKLTFVCVCVCVCVCVRA